MFNAVSRKRLREIIAEEFSTLEGFADLLHDTAAETFVKFENGSWRVIMVEEGFSQGCPCSPLFAAIVLNTILRKLQRELDEKSTLRLKKGNIGDDSRGTVALALTAAYVDDVNALVNTKDVEFFLLKAERNGQVIHAILFISVTGM